MTLYTVQYTTQQGVGSYECASHPTFSTKCASETRKSKLFYKNVRKLCFVHNKKTPQILSVALLPQREALVPQREGLVPQKVELVPQKEAPVRQKYDLVP